jgi:HSP20 family protein
MAEKQTDVARREERAPARRELRSELGSPFATLERFAEEMDRLFDDFGLGRTWLTPRLGRGWLRPPFRAIEREAWAPDVEVFERNNELVVRADLPGLTKDDVKVDVTEDHVTIQGERKREREEEKEGVYRSERSYGSFYRSIPLPEGAIVEQAKASFKDGVLEVAMPAPPEQVRRGRRVEITEGAPAKK